MGATLAGLSIIPCGQGRIFAIRKGIYGANLLLDFARCVRDERASLRWLVEAAATHQALWGAGHKDMARYCVPILAVRHGYVIVQAESEHDALAQGWDAITANTFSWLFEPTFSVEKPYVYLT
jgi:hypothetical protein